jgi:hypothetical protein
MNGRFARFAKSPVRGPEMSISIPVPSRHSGSNNNQRAKLIEAAAQAIRTACANRSGRGKPWDQLPERMRADYRLEAEAALQAVGVIQ